MILGTGNIVNGMNHTFTYSILTELPVREGGRQDAVKGEEGGKEEEGVKGESKG